MFVFTTYALYSPDYDKIYIGYSSDFEARLRSHNELGTKGWTIKYRPWKVVFTVEYETKSEAMRREKQLKSGGGRRFIWQDVLQNNQTCHLTHRVYLKTAKVLPV